MAFQARHRWIIQKINDLLEIRDEAYVEETMRGEDNFKMLNRFFKADGPDIIFFYFQPLDVLDEDGSLVAGEGEPGTTMSLSLSLFAPLLSYNLFSLFSPLLPSLIIFSLSSPLLP